MNLRHGTKFTVNLNLLSENFKKLKKLAPNNEIIFMVKANAYGHGLEKICDYSYRHLAINSFGVASLGEALAIRKSCPGYTGNIFVFSDNELFRDKHLLEYSHHKLTPVIGSLEQLDLYLNSPLKKDCPLVIKLDTGMNRLGIGYEQINELIEILKENQVKKIDHLMTHFSSSSIKLKENDRTYKQYDRFKKAKVKLSEFFEVKATSCANSGAIEQGFSLEESHIRPGLMLYGPPSVGAFRDQPSTWNGQIISCLESTIIKINKVNKGTPVGYGGHICHAEGVVVYLPIGYGDGFLTYYSGAKLLVDNKEAKVLGRVNMDLVALFYEKANCDDFTLGQKIKIWDQDQKSMLDLCTRVRTIPYQVLTAITSRVPKVYLE